MKVFIIAVFLSFMGVAVMAQSTSGLVCNVADRGWEEHRNGHKTCEECLKHHGRCVETCSLSYYTCEATGRDHNGSSITLTGSGEDRWEAERNALRHCERNFERCSSRGCSSKSQTITRKECK